MPVSHKRATLIVGAVVHVFVFCSLVTFNVSAVTSTSRSGLTMTPALKQLEVSSGLIEAHSNITLTNNTASTVSATVRPTDLSSINNSFGFSGAAVAQYGLANWMTLPSGNKIVIPSGATATIPVVVSNRSDLAPGGHYGAVVISATSAATNSSNNVGFRQELVSLVFVKKLGGEQYGLKLTNTKPDNASPVPRTVTLTFRGTGNVDSVPRGFVQLTDSRDKVLAKGIINPESTIVLPNGERQFKVNMQYVANSKVPGNKTLTTYYRPEGVSQFTVSTLQLSNGPWLGILIATALAVIVVVAYLLRKCLKR